MTTTLHRQIAQAILAGHDLDEIELSIIQPAPVAEDEKSALWLYAQALSERPPLVLPSGEPSAVH